ncbi:MAG: helix-turn-helix transcriptional regulator [Fimbriimonadaceae bacterium]|nr:helix-turn-helix transcriptional regulator [Fimbriimonadaceae bacterium]QYK55258.1 MAG: helix-turn-helix transcriptional regulator [Fimbriimonadaceae bacterium]
MLKRVGIVGIFALYCESAQDNPGALGGHLLFMHEGELTASLPLTFGRHYGVASDPDPVSLPNGDGSEIEPVASVSVDGVENRVDCLWLEVESGTKVDKVVFRKADGPASFVFFDVFFEFETPKTCPFRGHGGDVAFHEIGQALRLCDRAKFEVAIKQVSNAILAAGDLDEARGFALTFLAVVGAAMLEVGADKSTHKAQLEAAKEFLQLEDKALLSRRTVERAHDLTEGVIGRGSPNDRLIDRALAIVDRNFAKDLQDHQIAEDLGLSTSHFRHLFRQATKQPFHKYVVGLRLERARDLLVRGEGHVGAVAQAVGFASPAHFSRAFSRRFGSPPSAIRRGD